MHPTGPIARRFPLVARIRPACLPLGARVDKLVELADAGTRQTDPGLASTVYNQAALLASDLHLTQYARELCHRHANHYLRLAPLPAMSAIRPLEPVVNLARLHIRTHHGDDGHRLLLALYDAVTTGRQTILDGITIPTRLTETGEQRADVHRWLWRVVLADGTRALTSAGRWNDALQHLHNHHGVGNRILDGRQVAILARATTGDTDGALALLDETEPGEPWENAVTAVLTALCTPGNSTTAAAALDHCHGLEETDGLALFTTRLALTVIDAATEPQREQARNLTRTLISRTTESGDGYALREILAHPTCRAELTPSEGRALTASLTACGLGSGHLPHHARTRLESAVTMAAHVLEKAPFDRNPPGTDPLGHAIRTALPPFPGATSFDHNSG